MTDESYSHWGVFPASQRFPASQHFEDGEPVALLTGGPAMTVIGRQDGAGTLVAWFDADDVLHHAFFPAQALYSLYDEDDVPYANADGETLH